MKAVILAAGRGSRMKALTEDRPKCMVELAGRSLLDLQVSALRNGGINEIAVVRGYKGEWLEGRGLHLFDNLRWSKTNMVVSLMQAAPWLQEGSCLISYADIFYPAETVQRLANSDGDLTISYDPEWLTMWQARFADPLSDAESFQIDQRGRLTDIGRRVKQLSEINGQYMGLIKISRSGWNTVSKYLSTIDQSQRDVLDMTGLLSRLIKIGIDVHTVSTVPGWGEIDSEDDLEYYSEQITNGRIKL